MKAVNLNVSITIIACLAIMWGYVFFSMADNNNGVLDKTDLEKIEAIRNYLSSISDDFSKDVEFLAQKEDLISWGCGPSSYALGTILNKKFFDNHLVIDTFYDKESEEIIERFGFVEFKDGVEDSVIDHAWIEIFIKNKLLYIDPTVARYGKVEGIAFEVFDVGQPDIKKILRERYGVVDNRISVLLTKIYNNIPVNEPPYRGMTIDLDSLPRYDSILKVRNTVSLGREPITWKEWVDYLIERYP